MELGRGGSDTEGATEVVGPPAIDCSSPPPDPTTPIPLTEPTTDTVGGGIAGKILCKKKIT